MILSHLDLPFFAKIAGLASSLLCSEAIKIHKQAEQFTNHNLI